MSRLERIAPALVAATLITCGLGYLQKLPCRLRSFDAGQTCYTDIYTLYFFRGLAEGKTPYFDKVKQPVEYPVLTGWFMQAVNTVVRWLVNPAGDADAVASVRSLSFFDLTALCLVLFALVTVVATAYVGGRQSLKAGLMVALAPGLLLAAYINWDLLAVALAALAVAFWADRHPALAGVTLGLAISAKFYPVVFLWPLLLLCIRAGQWRALGRLVVGTAGSWLVVNLPVMLFAWDGWVRFYSYSQQRSVDWGSVFYYGAVQRQWTFVQNVDLLNHVSEACFAVLAIAIGILALTASHRPRLPQLLFLVLGAFLLTNKVWSPQHILWLLPLIVLARPRLPAYALWQLGEVIYFFGIWWYQRSLILNVPGTDLGATLTSILHLHGPAQGINHDVYFLALFARFLTVLAMMVLVVIDILLPRRDLVRTNGADDPVGGLLDGTEDQFRLVPPFHARPAHANSVRVQGPAKLAGLRHSHWAGGQGG